MGHACCASAELSAGLDPCLCASPQAFAAYRRLEADLKRRAFVGGAAAVLGMFAGFGLRPRDASAQAPVRPLLLTHLRLFDGVTRSMQEGIDVLIEGERITGLLPRGQRPDDAEVIDCGGRAVIPGLIDCHFHITLAGVNELVALTGDPAFLHLVSGQVAGALLDQGVTSIRDVGGPAFGLRMAIDRGILPGPRIFAAGAALSQTAGHGDFRMLDEVPRMPSTPASRVEREGVNVIADGVPEVLRRTREQLMKGANQIKIMAGGGVSSLYDPLDTVQYTLEEMRAAVQAAEDWGTYVCAHVYTPRAIGRCIEAGIRSIEHGQLADEETVARMADAGVWWSIQPFFADEDSNPKADPRSREKQLEVSLGTERAFEFAARHPVRLAFGTDVLFNPRTSRLIGRQLNKFSRYMTSLDALHLATGAAGELLGMSGERAPYDGRLGIIAEGALADLLVVDGNPETSLDFLEDYNANLRLIMKGGSIHKRAL